MPENVNAVNQLYNCVKLPAVVVQVYQPLKCSLAKSHSRQGRNDICGIKSKLEQTFDYFSRGAGQEEQCHLWLLSWTLCGHNIHHTHKVNIYFTPVFKKNHKMQTTHNLADVAPCTTSSTWSYLVCWSPPWLCLGSRFHRIRGRNSHWVSFLWLKRGNYWTKILCKYCT